MKFLYQDFLNNKRIYKLNEGFYNRLFKKLTNNKPTAVYNTTFKTGESFYDGNPIFSAILENRTLRIIQEEPESKTPYLNAWIETANKESFKELVISLELSKEAKPILEDLIIKWFVEKLETSKMNQFIKKNIQN